MEKLLIMLGLKNKPTKKLYHGLEVVNSYNFSYNRY